MASTLEGRAVLFLATDGVEEVELSEPWAALRQAGATLTLAAPEDRPIQAMRHLDKGQTFPADCAIAEVDVANFDALVLPGGVASPDALRMDARAVSIVREFVEADKPVGAICHAPWLLVEADAVRGRTLTSWPSLRTDIANAGGSWVDRPVQVDQKLITSRKPEDLPAFCARIVRDFATAIVEDRIDTVVEQSFPASDPPPGPIAIGHERTRPRPSAEPRAES
jgi:protease I